VSNWTYACCCDGVSACTDLCACDTSYSVPVVTGGYQFSKSFPAITGCGQTCYFREYTIDLAWTNNGPFILTKQTDPATGECCYSGEGELAITGTLTIVERYTGGPGCGAQTNTYTYSIDQDVPATITVSCGGTAACNGFVPTTYRGATHTLHVCDFLITCSHEGEEGDCDTCPQVYGPYALRCVGGTVSYLSELVCPDTLGAGDSNCLGYYQPGQCVGGYPYPAMISNSLSYGPFAVVLDGECGAQDPYPPCTLGPQSNAWLWTRVDSDPLVSPYLAPVDTDTKGYCGFYDDTVTAATNCTIAFFQSGCSGVIPWTYT